MSTFSINGISISGGNFGGGNAALTGEQQIGSVNIKFGQVERGNRQVLINGSITMSLGRGSSSTMSMNGVDLRSNDGRLWVNGIEVDFNGKQDPAEIATLQASQQSALKARFPGVVFLGVGPSDRIDASVTIAPGARIDMSNGLELRDRAVIGSSATVTCGSIRGARVDGNVSGGVITGGFIAAKANVDGGVLNGSTVKANAHVSGGVLNGATVGEGASVSGGVLNGTNVAPGRSISGGVQ